MLENPGFLGKPVSASDFIPISQKGAPNGVAPLDGDAKIPNANTTAEEYTGFPNSPFSIVQRDVDGLSTSNYADDASRSIQVNYAPTPSTLRSYIPFFSNVAGGTATPQINSNLSVIPSTGHLSVGGLTNTGAATIDKDVAVNSGSAYTIDPINGKSFGITLNAATPVLTLAANPSSTTEIELAVDIIQDGTGGRLPTWVNVTWNSGVPPTINTTIGAVTQVAFKGTSRGWIGYAATQATDSVTFGGLNVNGITSHNGGIKEFIRIITAAGAVTVNSTDNIIIINKTVGAATTVNLPVGVTNTVFTIKDGKGDALVNNITITPASGNIDGLANYVINLNGGFVKFIYNGTQWNRIG